MWYGHIGGYMTAVFIALAAYKEKDFFFEIILEGRNRLIKNQWSTLGIFALLLLMALICLVQGVFYGLIWPIVLVVGFVKELNSFRRSELAKPVMYPSDES